MKQLLVILLLVCSNTWAAGLAGLNYQNYAAGGAMPGYTQDANGNITNRTLLSTGTVNTVGLTTSSGAGLPTRSDGFIVRFYGYINIPTAGTYYFGGQADDGICIKINNISVVNSWVESGGAFREGSITLSAGVVPVEVMFYENGGGQMVNFQWFMNGSWQIVPTASIATDTTYWAPAAPALCCGGSSSSFNASPSNVTKVQSFATRNTNDSQVYIDQIGNNNEITVDQTGTKNNYTEYNSSGSFNTVNISQTGNSSTTANYVELNVNGDSNTVNLTQQSTGGAKGIYATVNDDNNNVTVLQKDGGNAYLNLNLSGGNKTVDITQQGSANHMADITLSGAGARSLNLNQQGAVQQFYSINSSCASSCQAITVIQGQ
jgi:hypothetical protein